MIRVVLDTNIIFSAIFWKGNPHKAVKAGIKGEYCILTSYEIIDELARVLNEVGWQRRNIQRWQKLLLRKSILIQPTKSLEIIKEDPDDNKFLTCAVEGRADYIVTGDKHILKLKRYGRIKVVKVKEFLENLK